MEELSLHRLIFVVASLPPHKEGEVLSDPRLRVRMTRQAVAGNPAFEVSDAELRREGPSFTVDTVRLFRARNPGAEIFFLLGADQLAEFHEWKEPEELAALATLVAVGRNGVSPGSLSPLELPSGREVEVRCLNMKRIDLSSTEIRTRVREGRSIQYLVPGAVARTIETQGLYRSIS